MSEEDQRELSRLRREKRKLVARNKLQELSNVCNRMGEILSRQGKYEEALKEHRNEEAACVELEDFLGVAIANRKIGECHSELGNYSEALAHQRKHLEIAVRLSNVVEEQRAWATIGRTHLYKAEVTVDEKVTASIDSLDTETLEALNCAEEAFLKSLDLCSRLQSDVAPKELAQMQGRLFLNLGIVLEQRGDLRACSQFIEKAIKINKEHMLLDDLQRCHHSLCLLNKKHGRFEIALDHVRDAIDVSAKCTDLEEECELHTLHGQICLLLSDFTSAKQALRKSMKKMATLPDGRTKDETFRLWKAASKLCTAEERLLCLETDNVDVRRRTYEKMGDLCCRVDNYEKALHFYHRSLELTEEMGLANECLAPLYLSLAQTYSDTGQYDRATHYYQLELTCWTGNFVETCKTMLNIAECEYSAGKCYAILEPFYRKALEAAEEAKDKRLKRRCLELLLNVQSIFGEIEASAETTRKIQNLVSYDDDYESTEELDMADDSSIPSDESSTDDEVANGPYTLCTQQGNARKKKFRLRRNEKGETPLHRACIDGNIKLVQSLLDQGHPVNIRDHSGWLPLHEAANHDHANIVELLLDNGAWMNDRGGEHCDGITPLHDAASNGNLSVIRMLLDRGASVLVKTTSGETVLGCLLKWQERAEGNTDSDILSDSIQLADELKEAMQKSAEKLQHQVGLLGAPACDAHDQTGDDALISVDSQIESNGAAVIDDWLVDDVRPVQHSRKRHRSNRSPTYETSAKATTGRRAIHVARSIKNRLEKRSKKTPVMIAAANTRTNNEIRQDNQESMDFSDFEDNDFDDDHDRDRDRDRHRDRNQTPDLDHWLLQNTDSQPIARRSSVGAIVVQNEKTSPPLLRIKVKILDKLLLVPAPAGETIGWLSGEAANRYYMMHGLRPVLSLSTRDGALLTGVDTIHHVISAEDEVTGLIESWQLPPLKERYIEACSALKEIARKNIIDVLTRSKGTVNLLNLRLDANTIRPICRTLQCERTLTELVLAGNRFGNEGLQFLGQALVHMPSLQVLDLSCNDITEKGILTLATALSSSNNGFQNLRTLKLGYNPLIEGPTCPASLCKLLTLLKALEELHLQSCCDSQQWPQGEILRTILSKAPVTLSHLDLSFNRLLTREQLAHHLVESLTTLPALRKLNLRGVVTSSVMARALCDALGRLLDGSTCDKLEEFDLALCCVDDECLVSLAEAFKRGRGRKLKFLDLSCNPSLSQTSSLPVAKSMAENVRLSSFNQDN